MPAFPVWLVHTRYFCGGHNGEPWFGNSVVKLQVSGPSSLHQTASPGINQSADVPVLPSKVCSTPSISEAGSQDHRKSGIGLPAVDIQRARPNRTTSTSNDVIALADLASFSMKVKEKRYAMRQ